MVWTFRIKEFGELVEAKVRRLSSSLYELTVPLGLQNKHHLSLHCDLDFSDIAWY